MGTTAKSPARGIIEALRQRAIEDGVAPSVADRVARVTYPVFRDEPACNALPRRIEAYFRVVMASRLARDRARSRAKSRLIAATVVADLKESGRPPMAVWDELRRGWTGTIPDDVLEEFRAQLCA